MDTPLSSMNRRPRAFARLDGLFWADPWMASHVLYAYLDGRNDDASRPLSVIRREVEWISSLRPRPGRLLDLGCGAGLHGQLFSEKGWMVTGIDASAAAIAYASAESADAGFEADYRVGDILSVPFPAQQDVIVIAYGTLCTLSPASARRLIARCRRALAPGGILVTDLFRQTWWERERAARADRDWDAIDRDGFWSPGPHLVLTRTYAYPVLRTFGRIFTVVEGSKVREFPFWYRWYEPELAARELFPGWELKVTGGLTGGPIRARSSWFAVVARNVIARNVLARPRE